MNKALVKMPNKEFDIPDGIEFTECDYATGRPATFSRQLVREPIKIGEDELIKEMDEGGDNSVFEAAAVDDVSAESEDEELN
jgi:hypothetical protein